MLYPQHDEVSKDYPDLPAKVRLLAAFISVARVRPRTSKGITDLLLPQASFHFKKKNEWSDLRSYIFNKLLC